MPDGKFHFSEYKKFAWLTILLSLPLLLVEPLVGVGCVFGYFILGRYITPDLDHRNFTSDEYRMMRELKFFGSLLAGLFQPYGYLFKHRSFLSHFPFISTLIRLIWLLGVPVGILWVYVDNGARFNIMLFGLGVWVGLGIADLIHWFFDFVVEVS